MKWNSEEEMIQNEVKNKEKVERYINPLEYIKADVKRGSLDTLISIDELRDIRIFLEEEKDKKEKEKEEKEKAPKK